MWLLFVPLIVVFLVFAGVVIPALGLFWVMGAGWPWLLIGLGMWLFWHGDGRHRRRGHRGAAWRPVAENAWAGRRHHDARRSDSGRRSSAPSAAPAEPGRPELPIDVQVKVEQIRRKVDVLLGYADRFPPFSQDLYLVRQTASDYLPRTIDTYLSLPRETAEKSMPSIGKTALQELRAQLELLDSKLDDIAQDLERQDTDRLLANRRFLEDRFGLRNTKDSTPGVASVA